MRLITINEAILGGLADNKPDSNFDSKQLAKGVKVEMEHTDDPEIAKDHLTEFPDYYSELEKMEKTLSNESTQKEYVIWGVPKGGKEEQLLVTAVEGKPITSKDEAEKIKKVIEDKYGATKVRIQTVDLNHGVDMTKAIN